MMLFGQSYKKMWKLVEEADEKDLPQQVITNAQKIVERAKKDGEFGHLLMAQLTVMEAQYNVAPDSLLPSVKRLENDLQATGDGRLRAVYATVLYHIYSNNSYRLDSVSERSRQYRDMALADPALLARTKAKVFEPYVVKGKDSRYFGDDLLSVIGRTLGSYEAMHEQYVSQGNRPGACLSALWLMQQSRSYAYGNWKESEYIMKLDSLINEYGDLDVSAELALERYDYMTNRTNASEGERLDYIHEALARWSSWPRMNSLRNAENTMTNPQFRLRIEDELMTSGQKQDIEVYNLRNVQQLTFNIYKTTLTGKDELDPDDAEEYLEVKKRSTLMPELTQTHSYSTYQPYEEFKDTLKLGPLPNGIYMLEFMTQPSTNVIRRLLYVSDLFVMSEGLPNRMIRFVVVNSTTGQPVSGAHLLVARSRQSVAEGMELICDAKGEALYDEEKFGDAREIYAFTDTDQGYDPTFSNDTFSYYGSSSSHESAKLYTDRSIYRPGQTVHVAALLHKTTKFIETSSIEGRTIRLVLRDANRKVVEEKEVITDKYGKAAAEFILPTGQLNGRFSIEGADTRVNFRVEEYKRPTYEVTFDEITETYKAGDTLAVKGMARSYAGVGIQGAKVTYKVKRRTAYWWINYSRYWDQGYYGYGHEDTEICSGETTTDEAGKFSVDVPLKLPYGADEKHPMFYQFVVETDVTDQAGESRFGSTSIPLGTRSQVLTCDLSDQVLLDQLEGITFHLRNAAGNDMENKNVSFRFDEGEWQTAKTNTQFPMPNASFNSGKHKLEAICEGDTLTQDFIVFTLDDTKPCQETKDWFYVSATRFPNDGTPVTVQVGSSDQDVHIVYNIISGNKIVESGVIDQSNALWNRKLTYSEEYGNGLLLTFAWVKNNKLYTHQETIERPLPNKKLTVRWETFRDRLTPGQKEEWKLVVLNPDGTPADAQLMATMYDKSLEQIYAHQWSFTPYMITPTPNTSWRGSSWSYIIGSGERSWESLPVNNLKFSHFSSTAYRLTGIYDMDDDEEVVVGYGVRRRAAGGRVEPVLYESVPMHMAEEADMDAQMKVSRANEEAEETPEETEEGASIQMRENLNETAFFYPTLTTDAEGRIAIKFTLPESLTTWRFMGIATTQDMKNGYIEGEAIAQKEVMIQPNMPRFLRRGDQAQLAARVFNTSNHAVSGTSTLKLLDPETNKVLYKQSKPFSLKAGETGTVTFDIDTKLSALNPQLSTLYICQVSASGKNFSDGEQHYLAVLPDQERVTVTVPFTQHEPGTKAINIAQLFPSGTSGQKLTVEYTNNPVWLMVQALPSVGTPYEENAIDQAAWLYSNLIAKTLIAQGGNIKSVFEQWKREVSSDGSLVSNLSKNEELKDILLQETPWVVDADNENEQKLRLADFFDENTINNRVAEATKKLRALQNSNGSWSWWPGMNGSFYMTVSITEMLTRLNVMAGKRQETASMLTKAFEFMGKEIVEEVNEMKKWEKKHGEDYGFPSFKALQYLYICALDGRTLPKDVKAANEYLIKKMKKDIKNQTIYEKALSAIILSKHGETTRSREYAQSLKEYTVFTEEKGRYYDTQRAGYSWYDYKIPTEVMAIEALKVITPEDRQTVEEMQRWLLQEKRTQAWDTPINSVNAVYAFLFDNTRLLDAQEQTKLAIDGKPLDLPGTAGIGYVKTAIEQPKGRELTATKTSTGTSWGAVYAQFMQPVSDIEVSGSGLTVKRELFVSDNGQWTIASGQLKVGDKVKIRITIESERDLDFVQVIDRRAACMEPVRQLSGYRNGAYCSPKDFSTNYYYDMLAKGKHVIETEYYIDREGTYETGTCAVQCAYSPEYRATTKSMVLKVKK